MSSVAGATTPASATTAAARCTIRAILKLLCIVKPSRWMSTGDVERPRRPTTIRAAVIEPLRRPPSAADLDDLARLLVDAVDSGAGVSFMAPLGMDQARDWWRQTIDAADARAVF